MAAHLKLVLSESEINKSNNTSNVTAKLYYYGNGVSFNYDDKPGTIVIDGTSYSFSHSFTKSEDAQLLATKSKVVTHNSDGKKTVQASATFKTGVSIGTLKTSASKVLSTIPRTSTLSLNKTSVPADGSTTVVATATKQSSSFTDTITVTLGSYTKTVTSGTAFTIPMDWINAISGTSAKATVKVTTKSGSTTIGSATKSLTITVPDSVKPVINGITVAEAVSQVTTAFGNRFVKGLSQLNVTVNASGVYGSTIMAYSTTVDGMTYIQQAFTSNVLRTTGTVSIKTKVTDSRGRITEYTKTITVIDYEKPTITSLTYEASGNYLTVSVGYKVYSVEEQNTKALSLYYRKRSDSSYTGKSITITDWSGTTTYKIENAESDATYEVTATVSDKIGTSTPYSLTTGEVVFSLGAGGKSAAFFGSAPKERDHYLEVNGHLVVSGEGRISGCSIYPYTEIGNYTALRGTSYPLLFPEGFYLKDKKSITAVDTSGNTWDVVESNEVGTWLGDSGRDAIIAGNEFWINIQSIKSFRPYYKAGESFSVYMYTAGFLSSSSTSVYFLVPLSKPVIGSPTITAKSQGDYGFILRQDGKYTHGSSSTTYVKPTSYTTYASELGVRVCAQFGTTTNAVNNAPIGITWGGIISFS